MSIRRKLLLSAAAVVLPAAVVTVVTVGPASAGSPPFTGPATGTVTCTSINIKVKFSPGLTLTGGGQNVTFKGKIGGCTVSGSGDAISSGKITGSTTGTGTGCAGLAGGSDTPLMIDIKWKGTHNGGKAKFPDSNVTANGNFPATSPGGDAGFEIPNPDTAPNNGSVTGSFAKTGNLDESFAYSNEDSNTIAGQCSSKHGLKKLAVVSGSLVVP